MKKHVRMLAVTVCAAAMLIGSGSPDVFAATSEQEKASANQILESYKDKLKPSNYNFSSEKELQEATVGISVPIYRMDISKVANEPGDLSHTITDTNLVEFAINLKDKTVTRMTVAKNGDTYSRYGFGGNGETFAKGLASLPEQARPDVKVVKLGPAEFLYAQVNKQAWFVYISSRPLEGIESQKMYKAEEIAPKLQLIAKRMIETADQDGGIGPATKAEVVETGTDGSPLPLFAAGSIAVAGVAFAGWLRRKRNTN